MNFIDFHCDTATLILEENQELKKNSLKIDIEKLQKGEALSQFFAMYIDNGLSVVIYSWSDPDQR